MKLLICVAVFISFNLNVLANVNPQWYYECSFDGERHGHEIACNRYYECRGNAVTGYTIYLYRCPSGYLYNGAINTCQVGFCDFPPSPTTTLATTSTAVPVPETTEAESEETTTDDYEDDTEQPTTDDYGESEQPTTGETDQTTTDDYDETEEPTTEGQTLPSTTTTRRPRPPFVCRVSGTFVDTQDCNKFHRCDCNSEGVCQDTILTCPPNYHFCEAPGVCAVVGFCPCEADLII